MGPRKKIKPNKAEPSSSEAVETNGQPAVTGVPAVVGSTEQTKSTSNPSAEIDNGKATNNGSGASESATSWYGGTWPRSNKSNPVTQVAKESISAAGNAAGKVASEVVASARASSPRPPSIPSPLKNPTSYLSRGAASSTRSLPLTAAPTKLNVTSNTSDIQNGNAEKGLRKQSSTTINRDSTLQQGENGNAKESKPADSLGESPASGHKSPSVLHQQGQYDNPRPANESVGWLGWFTKSNDMGATSSSRPNSTVVPNPIETVQSQTQRRNSEPTPSSPPGLKGEPPRSWLGIWKPSSTKKPADSSEIRETPETTVSTKTPQQASNRTAVDTSSQPLQNRATTDATKSYGWAFWSKDDPSDQNGEQRRSSNVGELALANSPSQSKPEDAVIDESKGIPDKISKRPRPQSMQETDDTAKNVVSKALSRQEAIGSTTTNPPKTTENAGGRAKTQPKNLVLPTFRSTYRSTMKPGLIQQLSRLFQFGVSSEPRHVEISSPCKVNRALAIGIHGYFPAPLIRSVLGQPTGTSIRFANSAASAIQKRCQEQGYSCEVDKVALEGEGRIAERVDLLWKLLLNWIEKIRKADLVMIACHSQGVPVAMMLVAKLISFGCVNSARIGVCAMAGVNMGPFTDYKSRWIGGSAGELFEFGLPDSQVSKEYEAALQVALKFGVRVVYVGSIDDQLVSLESSTFGALSHPYIYRAVFVDGRVHAPDFLTHLVGFALKLRNLGISDHGLIRELSSPLAGSLYGGEGHSRIYDEEAVYDLAVEYTLETTSVGNVAIQVNREATLGGQNPYILPFAMRGLLEEEYVKTELYGEITELIRQFDNWKPTKTVLKDVKFRLEGVRSKL